MPHSGLETLAMKSRHFHFVGLLVLYLGAIEVVHLMVLINAATKLASSGVMPFPATPPADGWSGREQLVLVGLGVFDAVVACLAFVVVYSFFRRLSWSRRAGAICLVAVNISALVYASLVIGRQAWQQDPVGYAWVVVAYLPLVLLSIMWVLGPTSNGAGRAGATRSMLGGIT